MEIKGTAVKPTLEYLQEKFPARYSEWLQSLPPVSKAIMEQPIYATSWYDLTDSVIVPTQKAGDLFFNGSHEEAARELGRYSSDVALKGIYKIFVRISSPHFVLSRATNIFSTYYRPSDIKVVESKDKGFVIELKMFQQKEALIMERIAGWIENTIRLTLKSPLRVDVHNNVQNGEFISTITSIWS